MFSHISWEQYFAYTAATGLLYYVSVIFLYYRDNLILFVKHPFKRSATNVSLEHSQRSERDILGQARVSDDAFAINSEELRFYEAGNIEEISDEKLSEIAEIKEASISIQELTDSFVTELKENLLILKEAQGNEDEFNALFRVTASKYPQLKEGEHQELNLLIEKLVSDECLEFNVASEEIERLWH